MQLFQFSLSVTSWKYRSWIRRNNKTACSLPNIHKWDSCIPCIHQRTQSHMDTLKYIFQHQTLVVGFFFLHGENFTFNASGLSSQTIGNTVGISWIAIGNAFKRFFITHLFADLVEFIISGLTIIRAHSNPILLTGNLDPPFGPSGRITPGQTKLKQLLSFWLFDLLQFIFHKNNRCIFLIQCYKRHVATGRNSRTDRSCEHRPVPMLEPRHRWW